MEAQRPWHRYFGLCGYPTHNEYFTQDVAATIYTKLGIPLDLTTYTPDNRPMRLNEGRPIREWM